MNVCETGAKPGIARRTRRRGTPGVPRRNRGDPAIKPERRVVLLPSDTDAPSFWVDERSVAGDGAAEKSADIAGDNPMTDLELIEELHRRFHSVSAATVPERIAHLEIQELRFTDGNGAPFGNIKHLVRGDDKSGAAFDIYRLGWFGGRVWELAIIDGAYLPHLHQKTSSEFFILAGGGHVSRDAEWSAYRPRTRLSVGSGVAHGFITDPDFGLTVFLSIQSDPIRKIVVEPQTHAERSEDDFVYVDDRFPLPADLLEDRKRKLAAGKPRTLPEQRESRNRVLSNAG